MNTIQAGGVAVSAAPTVRARCPKTVEKSHPQGTKSLRTNIKLIPPIRPIKPISPIKQSPPPISKSNITLNPQL